MPSYVVNYQKKRKENSEGMTFCVDKSIWREKNHKIKLVYTFFALCSKSIKTQVFTPFYKILLNTDIYWNRIGLWHWNAQAIVLINILKLT